MTAADALMSADMREAIGLTREGHLTEATAALMQRLFHGYQPFGGIPEARMDSAATGRSPPSARHSSRVFDMDRTTGAVAADGRATPSISRTPEAFRGFLDEINLPGMTGNSPRP